MTDLAKDIENGGQGHTSEEDTPDGLLDRSSLDNVPSTPPVKWHIGRTAVDREFMQYTSVYVLIFIIAVTSLINLSVGTNSKELWASLLSMCCGICVPQPKVTKKVKEKY